MTAFPMANRTSPDPTPCAGDAVFWLASTSLAVRSALLHIFDHPVMARLSPDARGCAELVLAEALNNIVKHAYKCQNGTIELRLHHSVGTLGCDIYDAGAPMPGGQLPAGLPQAIGADHDLPEGGFGWFLIRTMTEDLCYTRSDARNHLSFRLNLKQ